MQPATNPQAPEGPPTAAAGAARRVRRSRLGLEITIALCVKLLLLFALYQIWFSHPMSQRLNGRGVAAAVFGPADSPLPTEERPDGSGP